MSTRIHRSPSIASGKLFLLLSTLSYAACDRDPTEPNQAEIRDPSTPPPIAASAPMSPALSSSLSPSVTFTAERLSISRAYGINDAGLIVGDSGANNVPAIWTDANGLFVVGVMDGSKVCCGALYDVNASGFAIGVGGSDIMLYSQAGGRVSLGGGRGIAIASNGDVAGHTDAAGGTPLFKAVGAPIVFLPKTPYPGAYVNDMNDAGDIVGIGRISDLVERGVVWHSPILPSVQLGSLGGNKASAESINQAGDIVGWSELVPGSTTRHAVLWPATGGTIDLNTWPNPCAGSSQAYAVNDNGIIVGKCDGRPALWTAVEGMRILPPPGGFTTGEAQAINNNLVIVGMAPNNFGGARWYIANHPPTASAGGPYTGTRLAPVAFDGSGSNDPDGDALTYTWDFGDGATGTGAAPTHLYEETGSYHVVLLVTDSKGASSVQVSTAVEVTNVRPVANASGPYSGAEGSPIAFSSAGSNDPDADGLTYAWDFGDGSTGTGPAPSHTYADNGEYHVTLVVIDGKGAPSDPSVALATITNVDPTITGLTLGFDPVPLGATVGLTGTFSDPSSADTHLATIDWDDGAGALSGTVTQAPRAFQGNHTFTTAGVFTVRVTVTDDDGGSASAVATKYIVVYDPNGGFVTGGGSIASAAGSCALATFCGAGDAGGLATFGFVAKYKKGASTPSGNTEFQYHTAGLNFSSATYEWLVVAGVRAQYKGTGSINGSGNFGFLLTAIDGQQQGGGGVDRFRIKIWEVASGQIVYDNRLGEAEDSDASTALTGGSITIHK